MIVGDPFPVFFSDPGYHQIEFGYHDAGELFNAVHNVVLELMKIVGELTAEGYFNFCSDMVNTVGGTYFYFPDYEVAVEFIVPDQLRIVREISVASISCFC